MKEQTQKPKRHIRKLPYQHSKTRNTGGEAMVETIHAVY